MSTEHGGHRPRSVDENQLDVDGLLRRVRPSPPFCKQYMKSPILLRRYSYDASYHNVSKSPIANVTTF